MASYFSLLVQRKVTKRNDTPLLSPFGCLSHHWFFDAAPELARIKHSLKHPHGKLIKKPVMTQ